jgi:flavin reductase (DIM6/NTAB) family NADH-FMN oxidoreductase RutF
VSFTRPNQIIVTNLAASPRWDDDTKPGLQAIPTRPATTVDGVLVENCYLWLECELERTIDGLGPNSLVLGKIVAASVAEDSHRRPGRNDGQLIEEAPLFAYLSPGRFAVVDETLAYPFPPGFSR